MKFDNENAYLIHVKQGFDNSIRDLAYQISISAKLFLQDRKSGYDYINKLETKIKKGTKSEDDIKKKIYAQSLPANGIKGIFEAKLERNICFCLAFVDTATTKRCVKNDIEKFDSNIAKYCLMELKKEIQAMGFDFRVIQLTK